MGEALVVIRPLTTGFSSSLLSEANKAARLAGESSSKTFGERFKASLPKLGAGIALGLAGAAVESIHLASGFDQAITRISTLADVSQKQLPAISNDILDLAGKVGTNPDSLAEAFYHVTSTFAGTGKSISDQSAILKSAAEAAKIGGANLVDVTNALDAAVVSGIPGVKSYDQAVGALLATVGSGDMTVQDLADALGTGVLAVIKQYGATLNDSSAALAVFGDNNLRGAQAGTQLRIAVQALTVPTQQGRANLEQLGIGAQGLAKDLQQGGLNYALTQLHDKLDAAGIVGSRVGEFLTETFGKKAGIGLAELLGEFDRFQEKYKLVNEQAGTFQERWKQQQKTFKQQIDEVTAGAEVLGIKFGNVLLPEVLAVGKAIGDGWGPFVHLISPVTSGLGDVVHGLMDVQHTLEPVEVGLLKAFGIPLVGAIDSIGLGLHVIGSALHGVADLVSFFEHNSAAAGVLATVLAIKLIPEIISFARYLAAVALGSFITAVDTGVTAVSSLAAGLTSLNVPLLAVSAVIGVSVALYEKYAHAKDAATVATNALTAAMRSEQSGHEGALLTATVDLLNKAGQGGNIAKLGLDIKDVASAAEGSSPAVGNLNTALKAVLSADGLDSTNITNALNGINPAFSRTVTSSGHAITSIKAHTQAQQDDATAVASLERELHLLSDSSDAAGQKLSHLQQNQELASQAFSKAKTPTDLLNAAMLTLGQTTSDLANAQMGIDASASAYATNLEKQFPIFDAYVAKVKLNGTTLLANIESETKAILTEQANAKALLDRGLPGSVVEQLVAQGPEYVAAAAQLSTKGLQQLAGDVHGYFSAIGSNSQQQARTDGTDTAQAFVEAIQKHRAAASHAAGLTFYVGVADAVHKAAIIAGNGGSSTGDQFADRVLAKKNTVLTSMLNALPGPVRTATLQALGIATDAGGKLPQNLAAAIAANNPIAAQAAEDLRLAVQNKIDALHGKTISVDAQDRASAALNEISGDIVKLEGYNNVLKAMRYADGGLIGGSGGPRSDNQLILASPGEAVVPAHVVPSVAPILAMHGVPGFAAGGIVGGGTVDLGAIATHPYLMSVLAKLAPIVSGAAFGGVSGNVSSYAPMVLTVLSELGLSAGLLPKVLRQISTESGGNPFAINLTDSNALAGHPSKGLLQTIDSTFYANAGPYASLGPYNPRADTYAGLHYAMNRYGPNLNGLGEGHGYDNGGQLKPGWTMAYNGTGKPENVRTHQADDQLLDALKAIEAKIGSVRPATVEVTYQGVDPAHALADAGRELAHMLRGL